MATKLGEMLVEAKVLTSAHIEEALKSQAVFGGRLGTNLIEMGYLGESELARFLSRKLGLPCISSDQLMSVPPDVIRLVQKELAEKYHIVPLGLEKKRLTLAMLDPSDLSLMDEISFVTGYFIVPQIATELRMVLALEKYYGIKPAMRFVKVAEKILERQNLKKDAVVTEKPRKEPETTAMPSLQARDKIFESLEKIAPVSEPAPIEPIIIEPVAVEQVMADPVSVEKVIADPVVVEPVYVEPKVVEPAKPDPVPVEPARFSIDSLAEGLSEAKDRDDIADILVAHLGRDFDRVALFMIKGTVAEGWRAVRNSKAVPAIKELQISLEAPSALKVVTDGKSFYLGAIPDLPENRRVLEVMGGGLPASALLIPMMLMGRVVAIIYVDGGEKPLADRLAELQKIVGKVAMAFEILILKNKILMT